MSWEDPELATSIDYIDNPFIEPGGESSRRYWAKESWKFDPSQLEEYDSRSGSSRRYMRGYNRYLAGELRLRNSMEGFLD